MKRRGDAHCDCGRFCDPGAKCCGACAWRRREVAPRTCLRCDRTFPSSGPHHRLCTTCNQTVSEMLTVFHAVAGTRDGDA